MNELKGYYEIIQKKAGSDANIIIDFINKYSYLRNIQISNHIFYHLMLGNTPITYISSICMDIYEFIVSNYKNYNQIVNYIYSFNNDFSYIMQYLFKSNEDILLNVNLSQLMNFISSTKHKDKILMYLICNTKENRMKNKVVNLK